MLVGNVSFKKGGITLIALRVRLSPLLLSIYMRRIPTLVQRQRATRYVSHCSNNADSIVQDHSASICAGQRITSNLTTKEMYNCVKCFYTALAVMVHGANTCYYQVLPFAIELKMVVFLTVFTTSVTYGNYKPMSTTEKRTLKLTKSKKPF